MIFIVRISIVSKNSDLYTISTGTSSRISLRPVFLHVNASEVARFRFAVFFTLRNRL